MLNALLILVHILNSTSTDIKKHKRTISCITNYDVNSTENYTILAIISFDDFILPILHHLLSRQKNSCEHHMILYTQNFLKFLFIDTKSDDALHIANILLKIYAEIGQINFNFYVLNNFILDDDHDNRLLYKMLHTIYYKFIEDNKCTIIKNKSLLYFYILCYYIPNLNDYEMNKSCPIINIFSPYEITGSNYRKYNTDIHLENDIYYSMVGIFIHPSFEETCENNVLDKKLLEMLQIFFKKIECNEIEYMDKIIDPNIKYKYIRNRSTRPIISDYELNITNNYGIMQILNTHVWMHDGFYSFIYLQNIIGNEFFYDLEKIDLYLDEIFKDTCKQNDDVCIKTSKLLSNIKNEPNTYLYSNIVTTTNHNARELQNYQILISLISYVLSVYMQNLFTINLYSLKIKTLFIDGITELKETNEIVWVLCLLIYENIVEEYKFMQLPCKKNIFSLICFVLNTFEDFKRCDMVENECIDTFYQKYLYKDIIFGSDFYIDTILNDKFESVIEAFKNEKKDTYKNKQNNENIESAEQNTDNELKFAESHLDTIANENSNDLKVITKNIGGILLISIILKNMFIGILTG
ncbi:hypothetical protein COBT_002816 [Conglomerata obtusa]